MFKMTEKNVTRSDYNFDIPSLEIFNGTLVEYRLGGRFQGSSYVLNAINKMEREIFSIIWNESSMLDSELRVNIVSCGIGNDNVGKRSLAWKVFVTKRSVDDNNLDQIVEVKSISGDLGNKVGRIVIDLVEKLFTGVETFVNLDESDRRDSVMLSRLRRICNSEILHLSNWIGAYSRLQQHRYFTYLYNILLGGRYDLHGLSLNYVICKNALKDTGLTLQSSEIITKDSLKVRYPELPARGASVRIGFLSGKVTYRGILSSRVQYGMRLQNPNIKAKGENDHYFEKIDFTEESFSFENGSESPDTTTLNMSVDSYLTSAIKSSSTPKIVDDNDEMRTTMLDSAIKSIEIFEDENDGADEEIKTYTDGVHRFLTEMDSIMVNGDDVLILYVLKMHGKVY